MKNQKEAEARVVRALIKVAALVRDGESPNGALVSVARSEELTPGLIKLAVNAYNTGRTNELRKSSTDLFERTADFEVADAAHIIRAIYPEQIKSAAQVDRDATVSSEYDLPPTFGTARARVKLASTDLTLEPVTPFARDPHRFDKRVKGSAQKIANQRATFARELSELWDKVATACTDLQRYFKTPGHLDAEEVAENCAAMFGSGAASLVKKAAKDDPKPIKIKVPKKTHPVLRTVSPYKEVTAAVQSTIEYHEKLAAACEFETEAVSAEFALSRALLEDVVSLPPDHSLSINRRLRGEKRAFAGLGGTVGTGMQFALGNQAAGSVMKALLPKSDDKVKQDAYMSLLDPTHEAQLKAVRTKAVLHNLMNSPYFEGEDPGKITEMFNNISQLTPRAAEQPMLLEAQMRQLMAQGQTDPHSLKQLLGIENDLKDRDALPGGAPGMLSVLAPGLGGGAPPNKPTED